jgi:choline dehydrogenase-like flavoprotein
MPEPLLSPALPHCLFTFLCTAQVWDMIIVGAGIAGCAFAYQQGQQGRRVLLLERELSQPDRIVGELLQPGGYLLLKRLGLAHCVDGIDSQKVRRRRQCWREAASRDRLWVSCSGRHRGRRLGYIPPPARPALSLPAAWVPRTAPMKSLAVPPCTAGVRLLHVQGGAGGQGGVPH